MSDIFKSPEHYNPTADVVRAHLYVVGPATDDLEALVRAESVGSHVVDHAQDAAAEPVTQPAIAGLHETTMAASVASMQAWEAYRRQQEQDVAAANASLTGRNGGSDELAA